MAMRLLGQVPVLHTRRNIPLCVRSPSPQRMLTEAERVARGEVDALASSRAKNRDAVANGPRDALKRLCFASMDEAQRSAWQEKARLDAILGCASMSMASVKTGLRCYVAFVGM